MVALSLYAQLGIFSVKSTANLLFVVLDFDDSLTNELDAKDCLLLRYEIVSKETDCVEKLRQLSGDLVGLESSKEFGRQLKNRVEV